jgi:hypothetical protein
LSISQEEKMLSPQPRNSQLAAETKYRIFDGENWTISQEEKKPSPQPRNSRLAAK